MSHSVTFLGAARRDLDELAEYIALQAGPVVAARYLSRILATCAGLADFPYQGTARDDLGPDLRSYGLRKQVTIVFRVVDDRVEIGAVLAGGRNVKGTIGTRDFDA